MTPELSRLLDSLPPTIEDELSKAEQDAMDTLLDLSGSKLLKSLIHAPVINKDTDA